MPKQFSDNFAVKKKPALTCWHFIYFINSYFVESVVTGAGVAAGAACFAASGVVGIVVVGTTDSSSPKTLEPDAVPLKLKLESKINENSILLPRVLSGSLISILGDESKVNLKVSNELGQCIIGQDDDCLVSESTRKPGQIFDTVSVNGESFKVRYSGTDARLEKFNILPENDESFLPLENWTVEVIKENQPSKLYYKVTYKLQ